MSLVIREQKLLGSVFRIELPDSFSFLFDSCFDEVRRIHDTYSRFLDDSQLSLANSNLGRWQDISDEFIFLIGQAMKVGKQTEGNFDITLKSDLDRLGYDKEYSFKEKHNKDGLLQKIQRLRRPFVLDKKNKRLLLRKQIDFGGLGKGFALDQVAAILDKNGVKSYFIDAGGDVFARGSAPEREILLEHPDDSRKAIGKILIDGVALAASSSNRRRWGGAHHLLNSKTAKPADEVKAIFVISKKGIDADAYATALFTAGFIEGIEISQRESIPMLMISSEGKMYVGDDFQVELFDG